MTTHLSNPLTKYLLSHYSDAVVSGFTFLASGFESEIYTFHLQRSTSVEQDYVLRLFPGDGATEKLLREAQGLSFLQKAGYPVPELFWQESNANVLGQPFEIIEKLEGQALWPILASAETHHVSQLLSRLGLLLVQLHRLDWRSCAPNPEQFETTPTLLLDEMISQYRSLYTKYNLKGFLQITDWLDRHKHEVPVQPAVVHQDFHANNVLLCPNGQLFVIDWTQFAVSDYRVDLCWTLLIMGDLGNPAWGEQIFHAYASNVPGPIEHLDYFDVIVSMKLLASIVIAWTFNPEELGLQAEAKKIPKEQVAIYKKLAYRLEKITGVVIPELENVLEESRN
jgi:aminoglycoside phosphotransferase (APT) family kinase protein